MKTQLLIGLPEFGRFWGGAAGRCCRAVLQGGAAGRCCRAVLQSGPAEQSAKKNGQSKTGRKKTGCESAFKRRRKIPGYAQSFLALSRAISEV